MGRKTGVLTELFTGWLKIFDPDNTNFGSNFVNSRGGTDSGHCLVQRARHFPEKLMTSDDN